MAEVEPPSLHFRKPPRWRRGDTLAAISLSSGLAARFPHRYEAGKRQVESTFGVRVVETPHALRDGDWLRRHPDARADDLHWALTNPEVKGIISTIGGDDSVRVLPFLDPDVLRTNPKALLGFSDTTTILTAFLRAGVVAFHGPALMTDLAENGGIHPFVETSLRRTLFDAESAPFEAAPEWTDELLDWAEPANQDRRRAFVPNEGRRWLQGGGPIEGHVVGGCVEVLEFLKGTPWWPERRLWRGAVLLLETSEEAPPPHWVGWWLRNYGHQGLLDQLAALLLGRPTRYTTEQAEELERIVIQVLAEFGLDDLLVVANLDAGHTSPQMVVPLGCRVRATPATIASLEAAVE